MKKIYHRKIIFIMSILILSILCIRCSSETRDHRYIRYLKRDLSYYWNLILTCPDKQIIFSHYDSLSHDAYYVLNGGETCFDFDEITSNLNENLEISVQQGADTLKNIEENNDISATHLVDLEHIPLEFVLPSYLKDGDMIFQYTLLKRYWNGTYDGFFLILNCDENDKIYLMQCLNT